MSFRTTDRSSSTFRILIRKDREGNPMTGSNPEMLVGYDDDRAMHDSWYRRRITRHIARRFSMASKAMESAEGMRLRELFSMHGVAFEYHWEIITQCYKQLEEYHGIRYISDQHSQEESDPNYKPPDDPVFAASRKRYRDELLASNERAQALIRPILIERLQQNTGISDPAFYEELFKIRPKVGLGTIDISIGEDEVID